MLTARPARRGHTDDALHGTIRPLPGHPVAQSDSPVLPLATLVPVHHDRAAREYARTLLTGPHCCATTSFDHASPTSHRAQRECPATQIARHGCRQHAWAVRAHRDTVILTQHNTSFQGHQFLARCVPHGQPGMPPGMSHARALCTRVAQPWRAWSWRVRRQQWRRTVAPSELGRADRALFRSRTKNTFVFRIGLGVNFTIYGFYSFDFCETVQWLHCEITFPA